MISFFDKFNLQTFHFLKSCPIFVHRGPFKYYVIMFLTFLGPPTYLWWFTVLYIIKNCHFLTPPTQPFDDVILEWSLSVIVISFHQIPLTWWNAYSCPNCLWSPHNRNLIAKVRDSSNVFRQTNHIKRHLLLVLVSCVNEYKIIAL